MQNEEPLKSGRLKSFIAPKIDNPGYIRRFTEALIPVKAPDQPTFDWRDKGLSFQVRDQGDWFACTSFALTAMFEARAKLSGSPTPRLMAGYLHCCALGANDPNMSKSCPEICAAAVSTGIKAGSIDGPPLDQQQCSAVGSPLRRVSSDKYVTSGGEALNNLIANGPMLVEMVIPRDFDEIGVHSIINFDRDEADLLHCMLLIGYDWLARTLTVLNSFGASWGNTGFGTISMDSAGFDYMWTFEVTL